MKNYSIIQSLSVVYHQSLLTARINALTEEARIAFCDALVTEMHARNTGKAKHILNASKATNAKAKAFFAQAEKDNAFVPTFWVKG